MVALSDVFEHIPRPAEFLRDASRFLNADGILYIKVPSARWSLLKQALLSVAGSHPKMGLWDSYEHVVHCSDSTLVRMLIKAALSVCEIAIEPPIQTSNWHEHVGHNYFVPDAVDLGLAEEARAKRHATPCRPRANRALREPGISRS